VNVALLILALVASKTPAHGANRPNVSTPKSSPPAAPTPSATPATNDAKEKEGVKLPDGVTANVETMTPHLGTAFGYTVNVTRPKGEVVSLPKGLDLGDFDLVQSSKEEAPHGDTTTTSLHLMLQGWALGPKKLPTLPLSVESQGKVSTLEVPGIEVELVGDLDPDGGAEAPLRDIAPPIDLQVRTYRIFAWAAGALAMLLAGIYAYRFATREKPIEPILKPLEPAHVRAQKALAELLAEDLPGQMRQREFYFRLSEIVRRYLGERFGFDAIDLTTEELLSALRTRQTPGLDFIGFEALCREADLAKFARFQPDVGACKTSIDAAFAIVTATTAATNPAGARTGEVAA
jgi:hypothetical protein